MKRLIASMMGALGLLAFALPAVAQAPKPHVQASLVADAEGISPGGTIHVALRQVIETGWHTYWRNSGDSGQATEIEWSLPQGFTAGDIVWATPGQHMTGPLMNYGYQDEVLLPIPLTAPKTAKVGEAVTLKAKVYLLVCADVCVPEDADVSLTLPVTAKPAGADLQWGAAIAKALADAPKPAGLSAVFAPAKSGLSLAITGEALKGADLAGAYFYPYSPTVLDHAKPQAIERGPDGLTLTLAPPAAGYAEGKPPTELAGVLALKGKAYEITASPGAAPAGASGLGAPAAPAAAGKASGGLGLVAAIAFAFVGGLILNLMPCVFPVLAMKAASLAGHAHEHAAARRQGLAFLAGVLATFLGLAGLLIAVRAGGAAVGWGFQLQSPPVVAVLALLMLAVALNLSGLFEIGASLQGVGQDFASKGGLAGAFFTGALAVVVAAPCTAPFMAPALGWALTQDPASALAVFAGLGLGFAAPFTLAAFAPALLARLPKPGAWMETFRRAMSFPMYGAAGWLAWVLTVQAGSDALARLLALAVLLALGAWLAGVAQHRQAAGKSALAQGLSGAVIALAALAGAIWPAYATPAATGEASGESAAIPYEAWSPEAVAMAQAEGKPVFVNFTAAWCVTCQVNERVAFSTPQAAAAFKAAGAVYLKGDWTRKDAIIEAELAKHGRAGVPLYLVYPKNGGEPEILPQLLTPQILSAAVETAAR